MTISATARRAGPFLGNGTATSFAFTFKVFSSADIAVSVADSAGVETLLVLDADYTVTLNANQDTSPGGTVDYPISGVPLPVGSTLVIVGNIDFNQPLDLPAGGNFSPLALENQLDRTVMQIQQLEEGLNRALLLPVNSPFTVSLPTPAAGELLGWDQSETNIINYTFDDVNAQAIYADWVYDTFTGTGNRSVYTLQRSPGALANCDVSIDGQTLVPVVDFSVSGDRLTFVTAPPNGAEILVRYGSAAVQVQTSTSFVTQFRTASAGQTVFTLTETYVPGSNALAVYIDGLRVTDFVESNATTVTFTQALQAGQEVLFVIGTQDTGGASLRPAPATFGSDIVPSKHLKQFSSRIAGAGAGALAGAVTVAAGAVSAIALSTGGANYATITTRVLIVGDGTGAAATATIVGGAITGFTVTAGGSGYTSATAYVVDGPVVVLVGDSISTENPTGSVSGSSLWYVLTAAIQAANPRRNITFFNRAVGAQTWTTFNDVANANLPAWYSSPTKAWVDYVEELQPDLVIAAFGMNDQENFVSAQMNAAINKLLAFNLQPDIVLATTMVPSASTSTTSLSGAAGQNGRDAASAYIRSKAISAGFGLLDFNRRSRLVRDGLDVRACALRTHVTSASRALPWTAPEAAQGDFALLASFSGVLSWVGQTLTVVLGTTGPNTVTEVVLDQSGGKVRVTVRDRWPSAAGIANQTQVISSLTSPTGTVSVSVIAVDASLLVTVNDTTVFSGTVARFAGEFYPSLSTAVSWGSATITYSGGRYAQYSARATDTELWGNAGEGDGGNGSNHPSSVGVALMIAPVVGEAAWEHLPVSIGDQTTGLTTNIGIGTPDPLARLHVAKTPMAVPTNPIATANTLLLSDASATGISLMTDDAGACRIFMGDASQPDQYQVNFANSSNLATELVGGVTVRTASSSVQAFGVPVRLPSYTVAGAPLAASAAAGALIFLTDESGGAVVAFSDGTNWRRVTDRAIVS